MSARSINSGTITLGLISLPVKFYTSASNNSIHFNQLSPDGQKMVQQYVDPNGKVIPRATMTKGYEYTKGKFVIFTKEELAQFETLSDKIIDISEFVPLDAIDPLFIEKTYFLGPDKGGDKAYFLLCSLLENEQKIAVAQWNSRGKKHLVTLRAQNGRLILQQMFYAEEVREFEPDVAVLAISEKEMEMAKMLVDRLSSDKYDHTQYSDDYKTKVQEAITQKVSGQDIVINSDVSGTVVVDLFEALKKSLVDVKPKAKKAPKEAPKAKKAKKKAPKKQ